MTRIWLSCQSPRLSADLIDRALCGRPHSFPWHQRIRLRYSDAGWGTAGKGRGHSRYPPAAQPADLAQGHDPVLAKAFQMVGGTVDPEGAGRLFPLTGWDKRVEEY